MPYILVRSAIDEEELFWDVRVSGLKEADIQELMHLKRGFGLETNTISYREPHYKILNALEILDYKVITCTSYNNPEKNVEEFMWTMRKEFSNPKPEGI